MKRFFVVESDCLGIADRLRGIDKDYFLVFDLDKKHFELHNRQQAGDSFCLEFPFEEIDERMVDLTRKTRVQNSDALFEELEAENSRRQKQIVSTAINTFKERIYES